MKFSCSRSELSEALNNVTRAVAVKTTHPAMEGVLIKAGAAPTLLFRHGSCRRFEAKTQPAGIMRDVIAEKRTFRLEKGDLLLMLSDGVLQVEDPPMRIPVPADRSAHAYASAVLSAARSRSAGKDDMSVCAVRLY